MLTNFKKPDEINYNHPFVARDIMKYEDEDEKEVWDDYIIAIPWEDVQSFSQYGELDLRIVEKLPDDLIEKLKDKITFVRSYAGIGYKIKANFNDFLNCYKKYKDGITDNKSK